MPQRLYKAKNNNKRAYKDLSLKYKNVQGKQKHELKDSGYLRGKKEGNEIRYIEDVTCIYINIYV